MIKRYFTPKTLRRLFTITLIVVALWMLVIVGLAAMIYTTGEDDTAQPSDVIIVLGSGLRRDGRPGDALYRRSVWAAELYQRGIAEHIICTGGVGEGKPRSEAAACAEVLQREGVPQSAIVLEEQSRSTEENALYSQAIVDVHGWNTITLVTDSFHMLRASWVFDQYGLDHFRSPVPRERMRNYYYVRHFSREILALHWEVIKEVFNLPITNL